MLTRIEKNLWRHVIIKSPGAKSQLNRYGHRAVLVNDRELLIFGGFVPDGNLWRNDLCSIDLGSLQLEDPDIDNSVEYLPDINM